MDNLLSSISYNYIATILQKLSLKKPYKILGVDPGTNIMGYAILEIVDDKPKFITMDVLHLKSYKDHQTKLKEIFLQLQEIIETYVPKEMAIEAPFYGKNVQSMLKLGRAQGVCMAAGMTMGLKIHEFAPKKIKQAITGNGNASKEQVASLLSSILDIRINSKYLDATDALAAALTLHQQMSNPIFGKSGTTSWKKFLTENPDRLA